MIEHQIPNRRGVTLKEFVCLRIPTTNKGIPENLYNHNQETKRIVTQIGGTHVVLNHPDRIFVAIVETDLNSRRSLYGKTNYKDCK